MDGPLFQACEKGDTPTFDELYARDSLVLQQRTTGSLDTPLHLACRFKHEELALKIIDLQPDMAMATNDKGDTPLHEACLVGEMRIVEQLLVACSRVAYMLNLGKESALYIACHFGYLEVASHLCERMNFRARDEIGASCLRIAASEGYTDIAQKILEENPGLASRKDEYGFSAMHLASIKGKDELIKRLIEKDPFLSFLTDNHERTPLHLAAIKNQLNVVGALLSSTSLNSVQVADLINGADKDGNTGLHLAARNDNLKVIELLLTKRPIKVNDANNEGLTPLDILEEDQPSEAPEDASSGQRARIINQLKARKRPNPKSTTSLNKKQQALLVVAALIITLTFQAGLSPPGGLWQDSEQNHKPGKAIQSEINPGLFTVFLASDALGFISSLFLIPIIMTLQTNMLPFVDSLVVMALVSVEVAFIIGLIMISDRKPFHHVEIFLLIFLTFAGIGWAAWAKRKHAQRK